MPMNTQNDMSAEDITKSLQLFKRRRDDMLNEDADTFDHHLERFIQFCRTNPLARRVLESLEGKGSVDVDAWLEAVCEHDAKVTFPDDPDEELLLRYRVLERAAEDDHLTFRFGVAQGQRKQDGWINLFRTLIVRPFVHDLSYRIGEAADLATPEARAVQAVPLSRIPSPKEVKIFLSHKSVDKPLVYRYYDALKEVGYDPWLDKPNMAAGANLERELLRGFAESCAAVFFITENFKDEKYLATEIDYAIRQKRKKGHKFAIIILRYDNTASVPELLQRHSLECD
jgi:hypothetical protein